MSNKLFGTDGIRVEIPDVTDPAAVLEALQAHGIDGAVYRISAREMAEVIAD